MICVRADDYTKRKNNGLTNKNMCVKCLLGVYRSDGSRSFRRA